VGNARRYAVKSREKLVVKDRERQQRVKDKRVLLLIRRYLQAGVMNGGLVSPRTEGTPQGGPLSPLLANVLLDEVDRALEEDVHAFARYADDCNVYVRSKRAGERVMEHLRALYAKLRLKVNEDKSAVARVWDRKFLGYSFWVGRGREVKRRVAPKGLDGFKERIRQITSRNGGRALEKVVGELRSYLLGCKAYFRLADTPGVFHTLDQWIARRLRMLKLKQWKRGRTAYREMRTLGVPEWLARKAARFTRSWWRVSGHGALHTALPGRLFEQMGLPALAPH
jgi:group II intron reverse transcriptase/maturase